MGTSKPFVFSALTSAILAIASVAMADQTESAAAKTAASPLAAGSRDHATAKSEEPKQASAIARLAALREGLSDLDTRTKAVRARVERTNPKLRGDAQRILDTVEQQRAQLVQRLDIVQAVVAEQGADEAIVRTMEATYEGADKLLMRVESWYRPRQTVAKLRLRT